MVGQLLAEKENSQSQKKIVKYSLHNFFFHNEIVGGRLFCKIANAQRKQTSQLFQNRCIELKKTFFKKLTRPPERW